MALDLSVKTMLYWLASVSGLEAAVERNVDELEGPPTRSKQLLCDSIIPRRVTLETTGDDDQRDVTIKSRQYRMFCV